jgi:hypothetical protein
MGDEPDLDPEIDKEFFESNLLKLDPALLTEAGIRCFERLFKAVNTKEGKLIPKRRATLIDDLELVGLDYCWKVVLQSNEEVSNKAIDLLKETFTNPEGEQCLPGVIMATRQCSRSARQTVDVKIVEKAEVKLKRDRMVINAGKLAKQFVRGFGVSCADFAYLGAVLRTMPGPLTSAIEQEPDGFEDAMVGTCVGTGALSPTILLTTCAQPSSAETPSSGASAPRTTRLPPAPGSRWRRTSPTLWAGSQVVSRGGLEDRFSYHDTPRLWPCCASSRPRPYPTLGFRLRPAGQCGGRADADE